MEVSCWRRTEQRGLENDWWSFCETTWWYCSKSKSLSDADFAEEFKDYTMSVMLSNDEVVDLIPKGRTIPLTKDKA
jgi:hypothetical protein